ncbi:MAG TPA: hypothetical protein VKT83_07255 [bacterium]|nr:hypothetical protein [bacterium]
MAVTLKVSRADLTHQADFVEPGFALFGGDPVGLTRRLFAKLSPYGVRLTDIRWDQGGGSLGDFSLLCYLFNFAATLRIKLEKVEIQCLDLNRVNVQQLTAASMDALTLFEAPELNTRFKTHSLSLGIHALLENTNTRDFINKFAFRGPENLGPNVGHGIVFYYGAQDKRLSAAVTIDLSAIVKDGLYFRVLSVWDGQKVSTRELTTVAADFLRSVYASFGLSPQER